MDEDVVGFVEFLFLEKDGVNSSLVLVLSNVVEWYYWV